MRTHQRVKLTIWIIVLLGLTVLYPYLLNTDQPFVAKWRALYIETAMSTMTHQWLATSIIPQDIIDEVMTTREEIFSDQANVESVWQAGEHKTAVEVAGEQVDVKETFYTLFSELDRDSMEAFLTEHPDYLENGYMNINIDWCTKGENTGIKTTAGDHVMAVNATHSLMVVEVDGNLYNGRLAIVKDSSRVDLGTCRRLFTGSGMRAPEMADYNDAILLTNASGFVDAEGAGNGGTPYGYLKVNGEKLQGAYGHGYKILGFDEEKYLHIGGTDTAELLVDAIEFGPALVVNGENMMKYAYTGFGLQPRTAIGQAADKTVLMLVIDGRQAHSQGATIETCKDILERYGAVQACNLDGGSSSVMYYNGRVITKPSTSSGNPDGRMMPNAFIVKN